MSNSPALFTNPSMRPVSDTQHSISCSASRHFDTSVGQTMACPPADEISPTYRCSGILVDVVHDHGGNQPSVRSPDATTRSGDDDRLASQAFHVHSLFCTTEARAQQRNDVSACLVAIDVRMSLTSR